MSAHKTNLNVGSTAPRAVSFRCPHCNHAGVFHGYHNCADVTWHERDRDRNVTAYAAGVRICPNPECQCLIHVVVNGTKLIESFPPEIIDFDSTDLPPPILASLEEAIKSHAAGCYKACALMVRRVLEELCEDKNAVGPDLKQRLAALSDNVVVPKELLDAADELRLLGNDAAHVTAKNYDDVGKEEAKLAIELAKELLKAVYQYTSLVSKLKALKKP